MAAGGGDPADPAAGPRRFGSGLGTGFLTLSTLPTDPLKVAERQNATWQTLAQQRLAIERLREEIARLTPNSRPKCRRCPVRP